ncbi:DUF58 domain-containing protein [Nocardioides panacisoli]|uniref:DUF58 domain-containing protein n=1 Tax=Nocardioides panacisoli TaxID=627624 RepID=UPI001C631341|nr:DUF58 domain-containing protein [Nocardioides panacisoli]QYJ05598.1 DUF58 domain-containing protein [Nocardioides panacisoli]
MTSTVAEQRGSWGRRLTGLRRRAVGRMLDGRAWLADRTERPRAAVAPVTSVVSPAAWVLACCAVACLWAGLRLHWSELWLVACFLGVVLLVGVAFVLGGHHVAAELDLSRNRVVVGERATGSLVVTNTSRRRILPLTIQLPVGPTTADFDLPSLHGEERHEELFAIPTQRRAVLDLGPVRAVRADPLWLLRRDQDLTEPDVLHVHPRTVPIGSSSSGFIRDLEGTTVRKISDHDVAFHALREYVPGDDRRFIHWKTSARTGTLMVRQFEETRRAHLMVVLSTRLDDYVSDEEFELAVSVAGSLGAQTLRDGHTLSEMTSTAHLRSEHPVVLLDQLSGVDYEGQAPRLVDTVRRLGGEVSGASVAIFVVGSLVPDADLRRARRQLPLDVRTIVVRATLGSEVLLRTMADLDTTMLGELDELPLLMRRLAG